jgi:hypothetical protein
MRSPLKKTFIKSRRRSLRKSFKKTHLDGKRSNKKSGKKARSRQTIVKSRNRQTNNVKDFRNLVSQTCDDDDECPSCPPITPCPPALPCPKCPPSSVSIDTETKYINTSAIIIEETRNEIAKLATFESESNTLTERDKLIALLTQIKESDKVVSGNIKLLTQIALIFKKTISITYDPSKFEQIWNTVVDKLKRLFDVAPPMEFRPTEVDAEDVTLTTTIQPLNVEVDAEDVTLTTTIQPLTVEVDAEDVTLTTTIQPLTVEVDTKQIMLTTRNQPLSTSGNIPTMNIDPAMITKLKNYIAILKNQIKFLLPNISIEQSIEQLIQRFERNIKEITKSIDSLSLVDESKSKLLYDSDLELLHKLEYIKVMEEFLSTGKQSSYKTESKRLAIEVDSLNARYNNMIQAKIEAEKQKLKSFKEYYDISSDDLENEIKTRFNLIHIQLFRSVPKLKQVIENIVNLKNGIIILDHFNTISILESKIDSLKKVVKKPKIKSVGAYRRYLQFYEDKLSEFQNTPLATS